MEQLILNYVKWMASFCIGENEFWIAFCSIIFAFMIGFIVTLIVLTIITKIKTKKMVENFIQNELDLMDDVKVEPFFIIEYGEPRKEYDITKTWQENAKDLRK